MKKISVLFIIVLTLFISGVVLKAHADDQVQNCGSHNYHRQNGTNSQFNSNCNSNNNSNNNSQSQSQTQNNNQNVTISLANNPTVAPAPVATALPSTGTSPWVYVSFSLLPLGIFLRKFA